MAAIPDRMQKKIDQARHQLELYRSAESDTARESCFAACILAIDTVATYVRKDLVQAGIIGKSNDAWGAWSDAWKSTLSEEDCKRWTFLTKLRNEDTHDEPKTPTEERVWKLEFGLWPAQVWPESVWPSTVWPKGGKREVSQTVVELRATGEKCDPVELCEVGIRLAEQLARDYQSFSPPQ